MPMSPRLLRPRQTGFTPRSISGLALWLDAADSQTLYTTDAGPVTAVSSPLDIAGCAGWWDASRTDKMWSSTAGGSQVANGGIVKRLDDLSGNGKHLVQAADAYAPLRQDGGLNGLSVLGLQGTRTATAGSAADWNFLHTTQGGTVFLVVKPSEVADPLSFAYIAQTSQLGNSSTVGINLFYDDRTTGYSRNNYFSAAVTNGTAGQVCAVMELNNFFPSANAYHLVAVKLASGAATADRVTSYLSGLRTGPANTATPTPSASNSFQSLRIGNEGGNSIAGLAEAIVFSGVLSDTDRARVEAYLAAKWGISGVHAPATATNDPVGAWLDKSGNGRHATQATGASRPTVSATALNGRRQLGLVSQHLRGPSTTWNGSATIYWVGRTGQASSGAIVFHDGSGGDQTDSFHAGWLNTQGVGAYGNGWNAGNAPRAESPSAWRNADIVAGVTLSTTEAVARVNGATANTVAALTGTLSQAAAAQFYVGREAFGTWTNLNGSLAELLIYQPALNASQRARLERYLAAKWGITLAPQVSNADAQDWINRVYANGGTVSAATANAVNQFCVDIENAGIRDRFYRLNLFCGNSDGSLAAVRTPLFRGPSLTGTQYGNAIDTNVNFGPGDYAETGASGGLKGDGLSKWLNTGVAANALTASNSHMGFGLLTTQTGAVSYRTLGGAYDGASNSFEMAVRRNDSLENCFFTRPFTVSDRAGVATRDTSLAAGNVLMAYPSFYRNGVQTGAIATTSQNYPAAHDIFIFALNNQNNGNPINRTDARLSWYSIGLTMTPAQVALFNSATAVFNAAMGRTT